MVRSPAGEMMRLTPAGQEGSGPWCTQLCKTYMEVWKKHKASACPLVCDLSFTEEVKLTNQSQPGLYCHLLLWFRNVHKFS